MSYRDHSRSPRESRDAPRHRHRSGHSRHHRHHDDQDRPHKRRRTDSHKVAAALPFEAQQLSRDDLDSYRALFASYLEVQKQKDIDDFDEEEVKGRWKSFYRKWNAGELAAGWYDPQLKARIDSQASSLNRAPPPFRTQADDGASDDDSDTGPLPPPMTFDSLADRDAARADARQADREAIRTARTADRKQQKERLEELAPRAEPGTRERMLEKKREAGDAAREYRQAREGGGGVDEVGDSDLMGSGGVQEAKAAQHQMQRKKTEREQRREEIFQAKKAEREDRMAGHREKEAKTMEMFKQLARERFGASAGGD